MVFVSYSHRIIVDCDFIRWLSTQQQKSAIISKMLRININSKENKKQNIIILEKDFEDLCNEGIIKDKDTIRGGVSPFDINEELGDLASKDLPIETLRLITGVVLTRRKPFQMVLLTTTEGKKKYLTTYSDFLSKLKNFDIKNENEGLVIINDLHKTYTSQREIGR
ncbi:MAG: hypothetical protein AABX93_04035 [Nanoarchaeota archaeon]